MTAVWWILHLVIVCVGRERDDGSGRRKVVGRGEEVREKVASSFSWAASLMRRGDQNRLAFLLWSYSSIKVGNDVSLIVSILQNLSVFWTSKLWRFSINMRETMFPLQISFKKYSRFPLHLMWEKMGFFELFIFSRKRIWPSPTSPSPTSGSRQLTSPCRSWI